MKVQSALKSTFEERRSELRGGGNIGSAKRAKERTNRSSAAKRGLALHSPPLGQTSSKVRGESQTEENANSCKSKDVHAEFKLDMVLYKCLKG